MPHDAPAYSWMEEPLGGIERIELLNVSLPFVAPFGTAVATWNSKDALLGFPARRVMSEISIGFQDDVPALLWPGSTSSS